MNRIELINNGGKKWKKFQEDYVKGFAFIGNELLTEVDILNELINAIQNNKISEKLLKMNGNFSAVICFNNRIYLFTDKLKTYPLLYLKINSEWIITDQSRVIMNFMPKYHIDEEVLKTYLTLGYLHQNQTFFSDCKIVSAGTWVLLKDKSITHEYHNFIHKKVLLNDEDIVRGAVSSLENAIKRIVISIGERPIWIPLSGGYDSRLLACVCKKMNIKNVSCFTYGLPDSHEVKTSKQVAKSLGFPWFYVEYTEEKFLSIANSPMDEDYIYWAMNLNTTSHYQDFIAVKELKDKGIIKARAVIVPGHSGDVYHQRHSGEIAPFNLLNRNESVAELLFKKYFQWNFIKRKYKKVVLDDLGVILNTTIVKKDKMLAVDLVTNWNIKNRQANFIINSARVYEYFDVDWRIPLWDDELSEFWFSLS